MAKKTYSKGKNKSHSKRKKSVSFKGLFLALIKSFYYTLKYVALFLLYLSKKLIIVVKFIYKICIKLFSILREKIKWYRSRNIDLLDSISKEYGIEDDSLSSRNKMKNYIHLSLIESFSGNLSSFKRQLIENKSTIGLILGARGQGKSALGMALLEIVSKKRPVAAMGFDKKSLPKFIKPVQTIDEIPNGSAVLIDEGGILFSSRDAMSNANKMLSSLLLIARHKDLSIIFISQNSSNLELNVIRQADFILLKPSSLLQIDFERKKIKDMYKEVSDRFDFHKDKIGLTYIYSNVFRGFITNKLPTFWNEELSKSFKKN